MRSYYVKTIVPSPRRLLEQSIAAHREQQRLEQELETRRLQEELICQEVRLPPRSGKRTKRKSGTRAGSGTRRKK